MTEEQPSPPSSNLVLPGDAPITISWGGVQIECQPGVPVRVVGQPPVQSPPANQGWQIGQYVPEKGGLYFGRWMPRPPGMSSRQLGETFNVFAARQDLGADEHGQGRRLIIEYRRVLRKLASIDTLDGYKIFAHKNATDLYEAFEEGRYDGGWFVPTSELLGGCNYMGEPAKTNNLFGARDSGEFRNSFTAARDGNNVLYWSCTLRDFCSGAWNEINEEKNYSVYFGEGTNDWGGKRWQGATRLVRAEPVAP